MALSCLESLWKQGKGADVEDLPTFRMRDAAMQLGTELLQPGTDVFRYEVFEARAALEGDGT
jgi:hypothetical protein